MSDKLAEDTRPGDAFSRDKQGHVHISRTIPLPWLIGGLLALCWPGYVLVRACLG